jgi:Domain of unknown function (DUF4115)
VVLLIGGLVAVVVVLGVVAAVLLARRNHDGEHSVQHYHRQLHTLEEIRTHPTGDSADGQADDAEVFPASALRVSGSSTVRLTESGQAPVPPVPPPPVPNPSEPLTFDDASPEPVPATFMTGNQDRVIQTINHRPRRLGGPAAAVGAVLVLVVVLILTGLHSDNAKHHGKTASTVTSTPATTHPTTPHRHHATTTTTTTTAPTVSAASAATTHTATYTVATAAYSLTVGATSGQCWVEVTSTTSGTVLFTTTLQSGQSHAIAATGPVTVIAGAPAVFTANVNGAAVTLPPGNQAPFTLNFQTAGSSTTTNTTTTAPA